MPHKMKTHQGLNLLNKKSKSAVKGREVRSTNRWKRVSQSVRDKYPMCQWPDGCSEIAESVHHIVSIEDAPALAFAESNLIPLCEQHHKWCNEMERGGVSTKFKFLDWINKQENRYEDYFDEHP